MNVLPDFCREEDRQVQSERDDWSYFIGCIVQIADLFYLTVRAFDLLIAISM